MLNELLTFTVLCQALSLKKADKTYLAPCFLPHSRRGVGVYR
jgi:hypothetical protein